MSRSAGHGQVRRTRSWGSSAIYEVSGEIGQQGKQAFELAGANRRERRGISAPAPPGCRACVPDQECSSATDEWRSPILDTARVPDHRQSRRRLGQYQLGHQTLSPVDSRYPHQPPPSPGALMDAVLVALYQRFVPESCHHSSGAATPPPSVTAHYFACRGKRRLGRAASPDARRGATALQRRCVHGRLLMPLNPSYSTPRAHPHHSDVPAPGQPAEARRDDTRRDSAAG